MSGTSLNAILFLISIAFDFYLSILFLRFILAWVKADYHHPFTQFVVKLTSFIVKPVKRFVPDIRGIEISTILLMLVVALIKRFLIIILSFGLHSVVGLLILAFSDTLKIMLETFSLILIVQALISWIQPASPNYFALAKMTSPVLRPVQKIIPPVSGIDISIFIVIIILQLLVVTIANPMEGLGQAIAVGARTVI
jgi:YggT family protein